MSAPSTESPVLAAQSALAAWAAGLSCEEVPARVRARLGLVIASTLGVGIAGGRLPERAPLVEAWAPPDGPALLWGTARHATVEAAAWLNGSALVGLELDEGNKYAGGHPAAHGFPAVLALAAEREVAGPTLEVALLVAYEVAARFGRATLLRPGMHPHGNWGVAGAAAGCARLLGLGAGDLGAAIDTAAGMPLAGPFAAALDGNPVRNEWIGAGNLAGVAAARLAQSGIARATGIAAISLGEILGRMDPAALDAELGARWDVELGYLKRHSTCAFTHPAADAALVLRAELGVEVETIAAVEVETFSAAAALDRSAWDSRLGAMFSLPCVVATALRDGDLRPERFGAGELADPGLARLAARVSVRASDEFERRLPDHRGARVTVALRDGRRATAQVGDPVGDAGHEPFDEFGLHTLLAGLLGEDAAATVGDVARALPGCASVADALAPLAGLGARPAASLSAGDPA